MAMMVRQDQQQQQQQQPPAPSLPPPPLPPPPPQPHGAEPPRQRDDPMTSAGQSGSRPGSGAQDFRQKPKGGGGGGHHHHQQQQQQQHHSEKQRDPKDHKLEKQRGRDSQGGGGSRHRPPSSQNRKLPLTQHRDEKKDPAPYTSFAPDAKQNRLKKPSTFLCKVYFANGMPEPASQPKLIPLRADPLRYTAYVGSSLEKAYTHRLHVEPDLGIPLDLLDLSRYIPPPPGERPPLDPKDELLLRDDDIPGGAEVSTMTSAAKARANAPRALRERPSVEGLNWLMSTQYIAPVRADDSAKKHGLTEQEAKMLALQLEMAEDQQRLSTREGRLQYIEESFEAAKETPVHPTNPKLEAVEVLPLLPFEDRLNERFLNAVFDEEPLKDSKNHSQYTPAEKASLESRALLKQFKGNAGKPFLAYMVPASTQAEQVDLELEEGQEVPFSWVRQYLYSLHLPKADGEREAFLFCFMDDSVKYMKLRGRLVLNKAKKSQAAMYSQEEHFEPDAIPSEIKVRKVVDDSQDDVQRKKPKQAKIVQDEPENGGGTQFGSQDEENN